jgi:adenine-specific DNA methylase
MKNYTEINPISEKITADRQSAKRYYGVHPYFTRRPYNVVKEYILRYSSEGDRILDPFGGSGVTAIEAFLENRVGIQNDINPLANFIAESTVNLAYLDCNNFYEMLSYIETGCKEKIHKLYSCEKTIEKEIQRLKDNLILPPNVALPRNSDVQLYYDLFTPYQLISLALLKDCIDKVENSYTKNALLLAWSATLSKVNKTFLSARGRVESRGGSSIFSIYRYKIAKKPIELPPWETFYDRAKNIVRAAEEISKIIELKKQTNGWHGKFLVFSSDVEELAHDFSDSIDYIFTDPPYGGHISYLDLSILWNTWLGILPSEEIKRKEMIVGGELRFDEDFYTNKLARSVKACFNMLKDQRWLSIVFQHWNTAYFETILSAAKDCRAELRSAVSQVGDPIWSMHKKKGKESVLAGEVILTFFKSGKVTKPIKRDNDITLEELVEEILDKCSNTNEIYGEYLFNQIVIESWKYQTINKLNITKEKLLDILKAKGWVYNKNTHCWIKYNSSEKLFETTVPV